MKKEQVFVALITVLLLGSCNNSNEPGDQVVSPGNGLPQDVKASCPLDSSEFNNWFASGKATPNGFVNPANSVDFIHDSNCNFYRWSQQMFLWLTSKDSKYGSKGNNTVMESPIFFTVGPDTNNNFNQNRVLYPHTGGVLRATASISQAGPNKLPVIVDKQGRMFEVVTTAAHEKVMVKNAAGKVVALAAIHAEADGSHTFLGTDNKPVAGARAHISLPVKGNFVQKLTDDKGRKIFLDESGNKIDAETGQATNDLLLAQNGSVVYYLLFVNDVYAYYQAGVTSPNKITLNPNQFPTTAGARDSICALARANGVTLPDSNALAVELKTSWVEAKDLPDAESNYIITEAIVPTYKQVTSTVTGEYAWMLDGEKKVKLAMIGMHIVGSVAGHAEMIWSTFEHRKNAPNAAYQYIDSNGSVKTVPQDTGTNWLLSANASDTPVNVSQQSWAGDGADTLYSKASQFQPTNVLRSMPWGSAMDSATNQEDKSSAASNTEIISINNAVYNLLPGNDVRKNYWLIGSTWTFGGTGPSGKVYSPSDASLTGVGIGTNVSANSTMETYLQLPSTSCFSCHSANSSLAPSALSHIFQFIVPLKLPNVPPSMNK